VQSVGFTGGEDETTHFDEERGLLGVPHLFDEGEGGGVGGTFLVEQRPRRLSLLILQAGFSARLEENLNLGRSLVIDQIAAGGMESCTPKIVL